MFVKLPQYHPFIISPRLQNAILLHTQFPYRSGSVSASSPLFLQLIPGQPRSFHQGQDSMTQPGVPPSSLLFRGCSCLFRTKLIFKSSGLAPLKSPMVFLSGSHYKLTRGEQTLWRCHCPSQAQGVLYFKSMLVSPRSLSQRDFERFCSF